MQIGINDINVFTADTPAMPDLVNANFTNVKTAHNDTDSKVSTIENTMSSGIILPDGSNDFTRLQSYKSRAISGATNATPIVITSIGHKFITGDKVTISGVVGNTAANGTFTITKQDDDKFSLDSSVGNGTYTSGGTALLTPANDNNLVNLGYLNANAGALKLNALGSISSSITLPTNTVTTADVSGAITITLPTTLVAGNENTVVFDFSATSPSLTINQTATTKTITAASNASPIVITATGHEYNTGDKVTISGVVGNTAANGLWVITRLTADTFSLNGSTGNGTYTSGGTCTLSNIKWSAELGGKTPAAYSIALGVRNVLVFKTHDNGATWEGDYTSYGINEIVLSQPVLTENGTLGNTSTVAIYCSSTYSQVAYKALDGNTSTYADPLHNTSTIISFPKPTKITQFRMYMPSYYTGYGVWYAANDNSVYTTVATISGNTSADLTVPVSAQNQGFYRYYKYISTSGSAGNQFSLNELYFTGMQIDQNYTT